MLIFNGYKVKKMVTIKSECINNNGNHIFANPLKYRRIIKTLYNYKCETTVQEQFFIIFRISFFVLVSYQIVTLTDDHSYLQLLMLKNWKRKIIYDNSKLRVCRDKLHNDDIIEKLQINK